MAYKIEDIDWTTMPEGAVEFMLKNDTLYFSWLNSEGRLWNIMEDCWFTTPYRGDRPRYKVADHHPVILAAKGRAKSFFGGDDTGLIFDVSDNFIVASSPSSPLMFCERRNKTEKQWRGPEDGLPPVGTVCRIEYDYPHEAYAAHCGASAESVEIVCHTVAQNGEPIAVYKINEDGCYRFHGMVSDSFRPIRSERDERDEWVEQAIETFKPTMGRFANEERGLVELIYDAIKSGKLKAPEVEK